MAAWPADAVERRDTETLLAYARNARTHSPHQIDQIAASIREWGWTMPVLVDEDSMLIAGHGRVLAARKLKLPQIPVMVARGWTDAQKAAYVIADNKLTLNAGWDDDLLKIELGSLHSEGFDLALTGFSKLEIGSLLADRTEGLTDPDDVPDAPPVPRAQAGDVWTLGRHTLYCADCLDVLPDFPRMAAVVTDPPYGIGFSYDQHDDSDYGAEGYGGWIWRVIERAEALCPPGAPIFVWQSPRNVRRFAEWFPRDWRLFCGAHNFAQMTKGVAMHYAYDAVLVWWKPGGTPWTGGDRNRDWHLADTAPPADSASQIQRRHPCPRPADQVQHIIEQWVPEGGMILEPFSGSGTTIIAAEITGRSCTAIEISPSYCDIAITRWEQFTGQEAVRDET